MGQKLEDDEDFAYSSEDEGSDEDYEFDEEEVSEDDGDDLYVDSESGSEVSLSDHEDERKESELLQTSDPRIEESIKNILPELQPTGPGPMVRMTELGFQISQLTMNRPMKTTTPALNPENDLLLEKTLSGRRRNRTGVRGRPKKVDFGFGKSTTPDLPPEVGRLMGQANLAYVERRFDDSTALLLEVIRRMPQVVEAYQTLGLIHEEKNELNMAFSYQVIAAHLNRQNKDIEAWRKLAQLSLQLDRNAEAIYYLTKLIRMQDLRSEYFWTRARLYVEREEYRQAILGFHRLLLAFCSLGNTKDVMSVAMQVYIMAQRLEMVDVATSMFAQVLEDSVKAGIVPDVVFVRFLLDRLMEPLNREISWEKVKNLLEEVSVPMSSLLPSFDTNWYVTSAEDRLQQALENLPSDMRLYYTIACIRLKSACDFSWVLKLRTNEAIAPLLRQLGDALLAAAHPSEALSVFLPLMEVPEVGNVDLCMRIGDCYRLIPGQEAMAISTFEAILEVNPDRPDARTALSDLYRQLGNIDKAAQILQDSSISTWTPPSTNKSERQAAPVVSVESVFAGLFSWDDAIAPGQDTPVSAILQPRIDSALRIPPTGSRPLRRRRYRTRKAVAYSKAQIDAVRQDWTRISAFWESGDPASLRQLRQLATPLIDDLLSNPSIKSSTDLSLLHGLQLDEWFSLVCKYIIVESKLAPAERAFRFARAIVARSIFSIDASSTITFRLIYLGTLNLMFHLLIVLSGLAMRTGKKSALLHASRWFFRVFSDSPLSTVLMANAVAQCAPEDLPGPFLRFIDRQAIRKPDSLPSLAIAITTTLFCERYDSVIRYGMTLLSRHPWSSIPPSLLLSIAVGLMHQASKRTCRNPTHFRIRAIAILQKTLASHPDLSPIMTYNIGRFYHQLGLFDLAVRYYRQSLGGPLRASAAFNLHLIFLLQGEDSLARHMLFKYIPPV